MEKFWLLISVITDRYDIDTAQEQLPTYTRGIVVNNISMFANDAYNHIFNEPLVEAEKFSAILATGYQVVELDGVLNAYNGIDTDEDTLTDWDEVDVEHWVEAGLITYNDDNTIKLPTVEQCMRHVEKSYVMEALDRLQQEYGINFGVAIGSKLVMPISSDPTHEDGDGDGYADGSIDVLGNGKINDPWPLKNNVHVYRLNNENSFVNIYDGTTTYYGGAQGWFSSDIKRDGGCGVVATANAFAYLSQQSKCQALYGYHRGGVMHICHWKMW